LVEDNEINQQVAREILEGAGLVVALATNGQEAVNAVKENNYDAVLMDVQMPVMDGYTATRKIREFENRGQKTEDRSQRSDDGGQKSEFGVGNKIGKNSDLKSDSASHPSAPSPQSSELDPQISSNQHQESSIQHPVPIIAMTAHAMAGDEDKSLQAGMNGHVSKPIDPDHLFATLQKWIKPGGIRNRVKHAQAPPVRNASDQAERDEVQLPESLAGFDLAAGLNRLQGNKKLYKKLLLDFGAEYTLEAAKIRDALDAGDLKQAHGLIHNLKGLAGNLAAIELQAASAAMENLVKGQHINPPSAVQIDQKFAELQNAIDQALESVLTLGRSNQENICKLSEEEIIDIPAELAQDIAKRIRAAVEMGDVTTLIAIAGEIKARSDSCIPLSQQIIQMAEDFDLDGIQKLAEALDAC
jgi:CheY-like chemotaxis protein